MWQAFLASAGYLKFGARYVRFGKAKSVTDAQGEEMPHQHDTMGDGVGVLRVNREEVGAIPWHSAKLGGGVCRSFREVRIKLPVQICPSH